MKQSGLLGRIPKLQRKWSVVNTVPDPANCEKLAKEKEENVQPTAALAGLEPPTLACRGNRSASVPLLVFGRMNNYIETTFLALNRVYY